MKQKSITDDLATSSRSSCFDKSHLLERRCKVQTTILPRTVRIMLQPCGPKPPKPHVSGRSVSLSALFQLYWLDDPFSIYWNVVSLIDEHTAKTQLRLFQTSLRSLITLSQTKVKVKDKYTRWQLLWCRCRRRPGIDRRNVRRRLWRSKGGTSRFRKHQSPSCRYRPRFNIQRQKCKPFKLISGFFVQFLSRCLIITHKG